jgi:thiamine-phosphate pyrophosphorylase
MDEYLSASANRAVDAAARWARRTAASEVRLEHLLLGVADQEESLGASLLESHGLSLSNIQSIFGVQTVDEPLFTGPLPPRSSALRDVLNHARDYSNNRQANELTGTDALLLALLDSPLGAALSDRGFDTAAMRRPLMGSRIVDDQPLATEFNTLEISDPTDSVDIYRIVDACCNRAREGLRVLEDFARFGRDDAFLANELKSLRHDLQSALDRLPRQALLASRDTDHDVGTQLSTEREWSRTAPIDVVAANFKRTQEALRSIEEFGKLEGRAFAEPVEAMRYRLYTLERAVLLGLESHARLKGVVLYVLVSSEGCPGGLEWTVEQALGGGAQVVQLREKSVPDRELLERAHRICRVVRSAGALFIMNDRPDIARLVDADGVHVGQEELPVKEARRVVGPHALVGVSTHSIEQARQAVLDGASYIGVGPTFPSSTKQFGEFPGVELIQAVHREIRLPAFAIGGIDADRVDSVLAAGARRVAVSGAVAGAADPRQAAALLRHKLGF